MAVRSMNWAVLQERNDSQIIFLQRFLIHFAVKPVFDISVNTNILILRFYGYIGNIEKISMDIFTQILVRQKSFKIDGNA